MAKRKSKTTLTSEQRKILTRGLNRVWNDIADDLEMDEDFDNVCAIECCLDANRLENTDKEAGTIYREVINNLPSPYGYHDFLKYLAKEIRLL